jgi:hypothetical protein
MKGDLGDGVRNLAIVLKMNPDVKKLIVSDPVFKKLLNLESFTSLIK